MKPKLSLIARMASAEPIDGRGSIPAAPGKVPRAVIDDHQVHVLESGSPNGSPVVDQHGCGNLAEEMPGYGWSSSLPPQAPRQEARERQQGIASDGVLNSAWEH
ncbi:hypothetical protein ABID08_006758 [Rhizobium binae]|uniref:Uncharacterized protein n=1 Tax=Rhizobium binae TaxID=1138190 RepID=A0ABV2MVU1_9HYPH